MERPAKRLSILILGGTRFAGRALARRLVEEGHEVCVSSRRPEKAPPGTQVLAGERIQVLESLRGSEIFNTLIDFTAYSGEATAQALANLPRASYLLISSTWLCKLWGAQSADESCPENCPSPAPLPLVTQNYLAGKKAAETQVFLARAKGRPASILRLPILIGAGDPTGRLDFYRRRLADRGPLLLVNGGHNALPLLWSEDAARAIARALAMEGLHRQPIQDLLPQPLLNVRQSLALLAQAEGRELNSLELDEKILQEQLPEYLASEPWWREVTLQAGKGNLFALTGLTASPLQTTFASLVSAALPEQGPDELRRRELAWLEASGKLRP